MGEIAPSAGGWMEHTTIAALPRRGEFVVRSEGSWILTTHRSPRPETIQLAELIERMEASADRGGSDRHDHRRFGDGAHVPEPLTAPAVAPVWRFVAAVADGHLIVGDVDRAAIALDEVDVRLIDRITTATSTHELGPGLDLDRKVRDSRLSRLIAAGILSTAGSPTASAGAQELPTHDEPRRRSTGRRPGDPDRPSSRLASVRRAIRRIRLP